VSRNTTDKIGKQISEPRHSRPSFIYIFSSFRLLRRKSANHGITRVTRFSLKRRDAGHDDSSRSGFAELPQRAVPSSLSLHSRRRRRRRHVRAARNRMTFPAEIRCRPPVSRRLRRLRRALVFRLQCCRVRDNNNTARPRRGSSSPSVVIVNNTRLHLTGSYVFKNFFFVKKISRFLTSSP